MTVVMFKKRGNDLDNEGCFRYNFTCSAQGAGGNGILAQLGEHLPYKQRVIGSSPIGPIWRDGSTG